MLAYACRGVSALEAGAVTMITRRRRWILSICSTTKSLPISWGRNAISLNMPVPMSPAYFQPECCDSLHFQLANSGSFSVARYFGYWIHSYFTRRIWQDAFSFLNFTPCNRNGRCNSHISWPGLSRGRFFQSCWWWRLLGPFYGRVSFGEFLPCEVNPITTVDPSHCKASMRVQFLGNIFTFCHANCATWRWCHHKVDEGPKTKLCGGRGLSCFRLLWSLPRCPFLHLTSFLWGWLLVSWSQHLSWTSRVCCCLCNLWAMYTLKFQLCESGGKLGEKNFF